MNSPANPPDGKAGPPTAKPRLKPRDPTQKSNRFRALVGYTTRLWMEGRGEVEMVVRHDHMNSMGIVHGGVYVTLLDAAFGHAASWCAVEGNTRSAVTVSLNTTFLAPARSGHIIARGSISGQQGRMVTLQGDVIDSDGTLCVVGQASFMYLPGSEHRDGVAPTKPDRSPP
jgi:uncharacterized protein (TIGR00369 family)